MPPPLLHTSWTPLPSLHTPPLYSTPPGPLSLYSTPHPFTPHLLPSRLRRPLHHVEGQVSAVGTASPQPMGDRIQHPRANRKQDLVAANLSGQ
ncbi:hypothetical protein Pcinc_043854 [Petrolisthes cinctipes]|uniref:Uncharacterized protein n=1 Tax=Petrolisthes cinctipes TaxID=88211 RepID=A0AAE1BFU8_PETCI|nr:hypothetical protein Pcinc_043854 [Petrolisthes cinctipes]